MRDLCHWRLFWATSELTLAFFWAIFNLSALNWALVGNNNSKKRVELRNQIEAASMAPLVGPIKSLLPLPAELECPNLARRSPREKERANLNLNLNKIMTNPNIFSALTLEPQQQLLHQLGSEQKKLVNPICSSSGFFSPDLSPNSNPAWATLKLTQQLSRQIVNLNYIIQLASPARLHSHSQSLSQSLSLNVYPALTFV